MRTWTAATVRDDSDTTKLKDVEWQTQNLEHSHYKVLLPAKPIINPDAPPGAMVWVDVSDEAVLTEPNKWANTTSRFAALCLGAWADASVGC